MNVNQRVKVAKVLENDLDYLSEYIGRKGKIVQIETGLPTLYLIEFLDGERLYFYESELEIIV